MYTTEFQSQSITANGVSSTHSSPHLVVVVLQERPVKVLVGLQGDGPVQFRRSVAGAFPRDRFEAAFERINDKIGRVGRISAVVHLGVVLSPLRWVRKGLVGLVDGLELLRGIGIQVGIGMESLYQSAKGRLDIVPGGILINAQDVVVILLSPLSLALSVATAVYLSPERGIREGIQDGERRGCPGRKQPGGNRSQCYIITII